MSAVIEKTVREIALEQPSAIRIFERFGIDYCCGGRKPLQQVCNELQLSYEQVVEKLEEAIHAPDAEDLSQWNNAPLAKLIQHIVRRHHTFVRQEMPRLTALSEKVAGRHGAKHPELVTIKGSFAAVVEEFSAHLLKEEQVLFPYIALMEHSLAAGRALPGSFFGTVSNPISKMMEEHEAAGSLLARIRLLSNGYTAPADACPSYTGLFAGLQDFENDLHRHVHLENNILFPRAAKMEEENGGAARKATPAGLGCGCGEAN